MRVHRVPLAALILTAATAASSCSNTSQQQTTVRSSPAPTASPTSGGPTDVTQRISDEAGKIADKAKEEAKDVAASVATEKQAIDVRAALMADKAIDASKIDVDADGATKTVTLKGTVPSAAQKSAAEKLARAKAEGYTVKSQLTVAAK